jgi:hypothetical protein
MVSTMISRSVRLHVAARDELVREQLRHCGVPPGVLVQARRHEPLQLFR